MRLRLVMIGEAYAMAVLSSGRTKAMRGPSPSSTPTIGKTGHATIAATGVPTSAIAWPVQERVATALQESRVTP